MKMLSDNRFVFFEILDEINVRKVNKMISFFEILDSISTACDNFDNSLEMKRDLEDLRKFACMGYEWVRLVYNGDGERMWVLEKYKDVGGIVDFDSENYIVIGYELGKLIDDIMRDCIMKRVKRDKKR